MSDTASNSSTRNDTRLAEELRRELGYETDDEGYGRKINPPLVTTVAEKKQQNQLNEDFARLGKSPKRRRDSDDGDFGSGNSKRNCQVVNQGISYTGMQYSQEVKSTKVSILHADHPEECLTEDVAKKMMSC